VKRLMAEFVPAADEVHSLQTRKDPEGLLFQKIAEQGHYAGRVQPTNTRQGTYAAAPSGVLLGSINSNDPKRMADMLRQALAKWRSLPEPDKWLEGSLRPTPGRPEFHYPADGLVLRQTVRDLPRQNPPPDWRGTAWNKDYAWFRKEEARSLLPAELRAGSTQDVPRPLLVRLGRFNLMDTVRGQSFQYPANAIQRAERKDARRANGPLADRRLPRHAFSFRPEARLRPRFGRRSGLGPVQREVHEIRARRGGLTLGRHAVQRAQRRLGTGADRLPVPARFGPAARQGSAKRVSQLRLAVAASAGVWPRLSRTRKMGHNRLFGPVV
jgi:hypothetical protein